MGISCNPFNRHSDAPPSTTNSHITMKQDEIKKPSACKKFLDAYLSLFAAVFLALLLGLVIPIAILALIDAYVEPEPYACSADVSQRIPCVEGGIKPTKDDCVNAGCCYDSKVQTVNGVQAPVCFHYYPSYHDYQITSITGDKNNNQIQISMKPVKKNFKAFNETALNVQFTVSPINNNYVRIRGLIDDSSYKKNVTYLWADAPQGDLSNVLYRVAYSEEEDRFTLSVVRHEDNTTLIVFDGGPLVMSENYVEFTVYAPTSNIYGLGEGFHQRLKHSMNFETWQLFDRSGRTSANGNVYYGVHPFYLCVEDSGKAHGVLLGLSQPSEVALQPGRSISLRTSGGLIELHVFVGPTPKDVVRQYTSLVGKPFLPPYWALGYHTCRANGNTSVSEAVISGLRDASIPHESDCGDALLLRTLSLPTSSKTYDSLASISQALHSTGRKMVLYQGPHVVNGTGSSYDRTAYDDGVKDNVFIYRTKSSLYLGKLDSSAVLYPDIFAENLTRWMTARYENLNETLTSHDIQYDGVFITDNTPLDTTNKTATQCPTSVALPPVSKYIVDYYKEANDTVCLAALETDATPHYARHNLYGHNYMKAVAESVSSVRNESGSSRLMLSGLSTFSGSGFYGGHWGGEFNSTWSSMNVSLVQILEFGLYGIPLTGASICGYQGSIPTEDLCWKWMQLGALFPLAFTYYGPNQLPREALFFEKAFQTMTRDVLRLRYSLLPYFYTQFYYAHLYGDPVVRPLFYEFPEDPNVLNNDHQFMWGSGLLITPALNPDSSGPWAYFPHGYWYEIQTKKCVDSRNRTEYRLVNSDHLPNIYIRGGSIIVTQEPGNTTTESRLNGYTILVALDQSPKDMLSSSGQLYLDDGLTVDSPVAHIQFEATNSTFNSYPIQYDDDFDSELFGLSMLVDAISIMSVPVKPVQINVSADGSIAEPIDDSDIFYNSLSKSLLLNVGLYNYDLSHNFSLAWN